jgi:hypothetical protein
MTKEPSNVKQLSLNHMCKLGLKDDLIIFLSLSGQSRYRASWPPINPRSVFDFFYYRGHYFSNYFTPYLMEANSKWPP